LSAETETEIALAVSYTGISVSATKLTRAELEKSSRGHHPAHAASTVSARWRMRSLNPSQLDQVILVGRADADAAGAAARGEWFGCADFDETRGGIRIGTEFYKAWRTAVEYVAESRRSRGAGRRRSGGICRGEFKERLLLDVTPLSLRHRQTFGGLFHVTIRAKTRTIPLKAGEMFTTVRGPSARHAHPTSCRDAERAKEIGAWAQVHHRVSRRGRAAWRGSACS